MLASDFPLKLLFFSGSNNTELEFYGSRHMRNIINCSATESGSIILSSNVFSWLSHPRRFFFCVLSVLVYQGVAIHLPVCPILHNKWICMHFFIIIIKAPLPAHLGNCIQSPHQLHLIPAALLMPCLLLFPVCCFLRFTSAVVCSPRLFATPSSLVSPPSFHWHPSASFLQCLCSRYRRPHPLDTFLCIRAHHLHLTGIFGPCLRSGNRLHVNVDTMAHVAKVWNVITEFLKIIHKRYSYYFTAHWKVKIHYYSTGCSVQH